MISGVVKSREAHIRLTVRGNRGRKQVIDAVIDTGYTAALTLPPATVAALGLRWHSVGRGILADGSTCLFDVFEAEVVWDRKPKRILVDEADTEPLVGMSLLNGYELTMQVRSGGKVTIQHLP